MDTPANSQEVGSMDAELQVRLRRIHVIAVIVTAAWLLAACAGGLWFSNRHLAERLNEVAVLARSDTKATSEVVERLFHELTAISRVLATNLELHALVSRYNAKEKGFSNLTEDERRRQLENDPAVASVHKRLTQLSRNLRYELIQALDSRGIRIVASEPIVAAPLLGVDLDDRGYFKEAMAQGSGHQFAVARSTRRPDFFFSSRIEDKGQPIGVVAVIEGAEDVGSILATGRSIALIVDSRGMVVATSHPEFYLRHISAEDRANLRHATKVHDAPDADTLRRLYTQDNLRPIAMLRAGHSSPIDRPVHESERTIDGRAYLVTSDPLKSYSEYSLFVLRPIDWIAGVRRTHELVIALVMLIGALVILFGERRASFLARWSHSARITRALNEKLKAVNEEKDRYLGIAAHDLRNPLASMRGLSELMLESPLEPEQQREFLGTIRRTSDEMLGMVNDLLDVAVIESGKLDLRYKDQDIARLVDRRVRLVEPQARGKQIKLTVDAPGPQMAKVDAARFSQVIDNLVSNAVKFSPAGTTVDVALRADGGNFIFSVQDQGPGISDADRKLLFRSFQKLSARPTAGEKSTGLGLAIVKRIVDAHEGKIEVESGAGGGTCFIVTVPATRANR